MTSFTLRTLRLRYKDYISSVSKNSRLTAHDLRLAHQRWPELAAWAEQLQAQWPPHIGGCHRLILDGGRVTLDLWLGDINDLTDTLDDSINQTVDAWFLDGFAPAKNPDMWSQHLFSAMARLARPGATLATFTSAGFVRRGLQEAGFTMQKTKGFGRKRDMLVGRMDQTLDIPAQAPWFARSASASREVADRWRRDRQRPALSRTAAPGLAGDALLC